MTRVARLPLANGRVTVSGTLVLGDEARARVSVMTDPAGDSATTGAAPDGLDLAGGGIELTADGKLLFTITTHNMSPVLGAQAPTFVYDWNVVADGVERGYFVQAGFVGGFGAANPGRFFSLCQRDGSVECTDLGAGAGSIGTPNNTVTIKVTPAQISAKPGSVIEAGTANGTACSGVCSTWQPVAAVLYNTGGDQADPAGYIVPGGVQVAIAAAGTPEGAIDWSSAVSPNVQPNGSFGGTFTPSEPLVPGAEYQVVARSCSGTTDAPACVSAIRTFTA